MNIGEFFVTLGFNADTLKVKDFAKTIGNLPLDIAAGITALAGIELELTKVAAEAMNAAVGFQMFSSQTGLSWQELQRWQIVAQQANVSAEAVASSVTALERQMAEIRLGRGNISPFQILGIGVNQNAFAVLDQLRERIKGLSPAMATNLVSQMGINPDMMHVLQMSNEEFARLSKTVAGMSGDQEGSFLRAKQTLVQFGLQAKYLGFDVVDHLVAVIEALWRGLMKIQGIVPALIVLVGGLAIAFAPVTAAVVGLLLILDDLGTYFRGGDSVFGAAINGIKMLGEAIKSNLGGLSALGQVATVSGLLMNPLGTVGGIVGGGISKVINQKVDVHVNSTAPAHDVAKEVKAHIDRAASQASLQTGQQGY